MKRSIVIALFFLVVVTGWVISGQFSDSTSVVEEESLEVDTTQDSPFQTEVIQSTQYQSNIRLTGQSRPDRITVLKAEVEGAVKEVLANDGDHVKEKQKLVQLDVGDKWAVIKEFEQVLKQAEVEYKAAQELEKKGYGSEVRLTRAQAERETARARLTQARLDYKKTKITAPYDSILERRYVEIGDFVSVGDVIADLVDLSPLKVVGFLSENQLRNIEKGTIATVGFGGEERYEAVVTFLSSKASDESRTFQVELKIDNPDQKLVSGLTADINIQGSVYEAHFISPSALSLADDGVVGVKVVDDLNKVQFIPVTILSDTTEGMWVTGLPAVTRLITIGHDYAVEGQVVQETNP